MTEKKKNIIYISIIGACIIGTVVVFTMFSSGGGGGEEEAAPLPVAPAQSSEQPSSSSSSSSASAAAGTVKLSDPMTIKFTPPTVFPQDSKYPTQTLNSDKIKALTDYEYLTITPEEFGKGDLTAPYQQQQQQGQ